MNRRFSGVCQLVSVALLAAWAGCSAVAGFPPSDPSLVSAWVRSHELALALANECLFFLTFAMVPGVVALAVDLGLGRPSVALGTLASAGAVVTLLVVNVSLGRLVYPLFGLELGADGLVLALGSYWGGLHAADLMAVVATVAFGVASFRTSRSPWVVVGTAVVAAAEFLVAYPWFFPPWGAAALRLPLVVALVVVWRFTRRGPRSMVTP